MTAAIGCVIAGGGVVGLAIGRQLALFGLEVVVLEAEPHIGMHTSSRNSEVIHAGIYYPQNSLKAEMCVTGKAMLYEYCAEKSVPHARLGKLIVANGEQEIDTLRGIVAKAAANGVTDLEWLDASEVKRLEPLVHADAAVHSPSTGIVDSHALMQALQADLEAAGGSVLCAQRVDDVERANEGFDVRCAGQDEAVRCRRFVNAAGLWASSLAMSVRGLEPALVPETYFAKGHYFDYGRSPFKHLIYPVPIVGGLGIHATNDLAGQLRFGPDAEWVDSRDYSFDVSLQPGFAAAIARYFPSIDAKKLSPSYTGLRPKLYRPGEPIADFVIQGPLDHGVDGLVNLFGIESPGLTSCLAIANRVAGLLA